jgi:hypothetical protein
MGLFDKLFGKKPEPIKVEEPKKERKARKPKEKKTEPVLSEKEKATAAGEPYVSILKVDVDPANINNGAFELDWNDKFILNLIRAGYKQKDSDTDQVMVDRWFQSVCRNIALEIYEQQQADPENRDMRIVRTKDLGDGRTEVS